MKDKTVYAEKYRKPGLKIRKNSLPKLQHLSAGFAVKEAYILEAGKIKGGEYQVIKVYLKEGNS